MAKLLEVVIMPAIKESLKEFSSLEHVLTEVGGVSTRVPCGSCHVPLQEKLASYEVNDQFVHHLVSKIQSTLNDVKVAIGWH